MIKAIQTRYAGYLFRSRLEARWAVFFDALKLDWVYEPEGFELKSGKKYLPDFRINFQDSPLWIEVKPTKGKSDLLEEFIQFAPNGWRGTILHDIPDPRFVKANQHYYENDEPFLWFGGGDDGEAGFDNFYEFCICEACDEIGFEFDGRSARIGCKCGIHSDSDKNYTSNHPILLAAFAKARAARFEHDARETYLSV